jgi:hypothetical protein
MAGRTSCSEDQEQKHEQDIREDLLRIGMKALAEVGAGTKTAEMKAARKRRLKRPRRIVAGDG